MSYSGLVPEQLLPSNSRLLGMLDFLQALSMPVLVSKL